MVQWGALKIMSVRFDGRARVFRVGGLACLLAPLLLGGCATLPSAGPTGEEVIKEQRDPKTGLSFQLVEVTDFADLPGDAALPPAPVDDLLIPPTDLIGPGDTLAISIYETGVPLFATSAVSMNADAGGFNSAARVTNLAPMRVTDQGDINVPFVGRVQAAGRTPKELQAVIRRALSGMSQNPQIAVSITDSLTNSVIMGGEIGRPGRLTLQTNRETMGDVVSLAGGYRGEPKDLVIRIERQGRTQDLRLSDVMTGPERDMRARPGDRIDLVRDPLSFSVMGASGRVDQHGFVTPSMTLAEALASSGGVNPGLGDPKAVFVFRLAAGADGKPVPMLYHINMMRAGSLFLSQRFPMQNKDVLFVGSAEFNKPAQLTQMVAQLFSPAVLLGLFKK
jgi:polysaccharide export outer membrane protein